MFIHRLSPKNIKSAIGRSLIRIIIIHQNPCVSRISRHLISFACLRFSEHSKLFVNGYLLQTMIEPFDNRLKKPFDLSLVSVKFEAQHFEDPRPCLVVACSLVQAELFLVVHHTLTTTHLFALEYIVCLKSLSP